jgi:hypothetical protein
MARHFSRPTSFIYFISICSFKDQDDPCYHTAKTEKGAVRRLFQELTGWIWGNGHVFPRGDISKNIYEGYLCELPETVEEFRKWFMKLQMDVFPKRFPKAQHHHKDDWEDREDLVLWNVHRQIVQEDDETDEE